MMTAGAPVSTQTIFQRALALHRQSRVEEARILYEQVLEAEPQHVQALLLSSAIALQSAQPRRAAELAERAMAADPQNAAACLLRGHAAGAMQESEAAVAAYDRAIQLKPDFSDAYFHRGNVLFAQRLYEAALSSYDRAIALGPITFEMHNNRGNALRALARHSDAIEAYDRAIELEPSCAEAHYNRGLTLSECRRYAAALQSYDRAVALDPRYADAHFDRGNVLKELHQLPAALASYDRAVAIRADCAEVYCNRGNVLCELQQFEAALASFDRAIALKGDYADAHCNRGALLGDLGRVGDALASLDRALAIDADHAHSHYNRAFIYLSSGDFENGWRDFEWRFKVGGRATFKAARDFVQPLWLGEESLAGKTILLHREQGLGDVIQFCRYAKLVAELGARVILEVPRSLASLLSSLDGVARLVVAGDPLPEFDYQCPLLSLPLALRTTLANVPARVPYLRSDVERRRYWQDKLGACRAPRVGLVWSGGFRANQPELWSVNHRRNVPLAKLAPLKQPGIEFYSLQKGQPAEAELAELIATGWDGPELVDFTQELVDFADTAALVDELDLVISVDTATAHLAGALGKPVWILNRFDSCWRWMRDRTDSPWYPTVRLYRQDSPGNWQGVVERVRQDLERFRFSPRDSV